MRFTLGRHNRTETRLHFRRHGDDKPGRIDSLAVARPTRNSCGFLLGNRGASADRTLRDLFCPVFAVDSCYLSIITSMVKCVQPFAYQQSLGNQISRS